MKNIFAIAKRVYLNLFNYKLFILVLVNMFYNFYLYSFLKMHPISSGEFILYAVSDQYFLIYFLIVILSWNIFTNIKENDFLIKIRSITRSCYNLGVLIGVLGITSTTFICNIVISSILSTNFVHQNAFIGYKNIDALVEYPQYFSTPMIALLAASIFFLIGFTIWFGIILLLRQISTAQTTITFWLFSYLSVILGTHGTDYKILAYSLDKFLILYYSLDSNKKIYFMLIQVLLFCIIIFLSSLNTKKVVKMILYFKSIINTTFWCFRQLFIKKNVIVLGIIIVSSIFSLDLYRADKTFLDLVFELFLGTSTNDFSLYDFIRMSVINIVPLYHAAAYFQKQVVESDGIIELRITSKYKFCTCNLFAVIIFFIIYILAFFGPLFLISIFQERKMIGFEYYRDYFLFHQSTFVICVIVFLLRLLELLIAAFVIWLCSIIFKNAVLGNGFYIFMSVFYFIPGMNLNRFLILGISSMVHYANLSTETDDAVKLTLIFCLIIFIILLSMIYKLTKKFKKG